MHFPGIYSHKCKDYLLLQPAMTTLTSTAAYSLMTCRDRLASSLLMSNSLNIRRQHARPADTVAAKSKLKSIKNLSDGFGSHRVHEADRRPVQDDGVDRAERFEKEGLLIFWAVSVLQLAIPLLLHREVMGQDLMGHSLLLWLEPIKEVDSLQWAF